MEYRNTVIDSHTHAAENMSLQKSIPMYMNRFHLTRSYNTYCYIRICITICNQNNLENSRKCKTSTNETQLKEGRTQVTSQSIKELS